MVSKTIDLGPNPSVNAKVNRLRKTGLYQIRKQRRYIMKLLFNPMAMYSLPRMKTWAILFITGIIIGIVAYDFITPILTPIFKATFKTVGGTSLAEMNPGIAILVIFARNAFIALLCILTARLTFGIYPGFVVIFNGLIIGYVGTLLVSSNTMSALQVFGGIAPHGVFELFGIFLACAIGFQKVPLKEKLKYSSLVWVTLLIAAITESTITMMIVASY